MGVSALRRRVAVAICAAVVAAFAVVLRTKPGGEFITTAVDDVGEGLAAGISAILCFWRASVSVARWRTSWAMLALGLASWSIGEFIWSYYELISSDETPFPSLADAGFLLFPVFALVGLMVRPSAAFAGRIRLRVLLDGLMIAASLFIISWATALGAVYRAGAPNLFGFSVSIAYPASDIVLITVAVLVASRARVNTGLLLLVGGLTSMAVADSGFAYLVANGTYGTGALTDVAWVGAFLAIGMSALFPATRTEYGELRVESRAMIALPYVFLTAGTVAVLVTFLRHIDSTGIFAVECIAIASLLVRQLLVVLDNRRLTLDVIAQKDELSHRAFHDSLTGLANRALFYDRLEHALDLHQRAQRPMSVIFVDLDDFKSINDAFGHDAGDIVLASVAERLRSVMRTGDTVARLGGDEFAALLENDDDPAVVAARLLEALQPPVQVGERRLPVRASIGSATLTAKAGADIQELLKQADVAMYAAKRSGKGAAVTYSPSIDHDATAKDDLEKRIALSDDVSAGRIGTAFQPIVHTKSGELFAMEALARWWFRGTAVPPVDFIPLADRGGFLVDLDLLVARRALELAAGQGGRPHGIIVSTNVGLRRMAESDLPRRLSGMLEEFGLPPSRMVVEVPEQDVLDDPLIVRALEELRGIGVSLAIDDFGVGYSNLSRLEALRPDIVKLDPSFIAPLNSPRAARVLLRRVIQLAHDLGAIVVAEGVETQRQRDALIDLECDTIQGFLTGAPGTVTADVA